MQGICLFIEDRPTWTLVYRLVLRLLHFRLPKMEAPRARKKLVMLGCCLACLLILLLMIPDVVGDVVTDWVTG